MERAGVLSGTGANLDELEERVRHLADADPPAGELLMMGLVDGVPIGRAWATLVTAEDGATDFYGNTIDLFPEFRGQGLTRSFLGALRRHVKELGVRDVHLRVYAHDTEARRTFVESGAGVDDVHLRKDLDPV
jgi:GNAT superfamily N-acetyltransferase